MMFNIKKLHILRQLRKEKLETAFNKQIWEARKPLIETQNQIDEEKKELTIQHIKTKLPSWSKLFALFLFTNFTAIEIFIAWIIVKTFSMGMLPDLTPLITLISAVVGQTLSYGIYASKSKAENTEGGITYEMAKMQMGQNTGIDNEGGCG